MLNNKTNADYQPYTYSSYPRPVSYSGNYNYDVELISKPFHGNIMYDKRVVRGNTWALRRLAKSNNADAEEQERKRMKQKRNLIRKQIIQSTKFESKKFVSPNLPVEVDIPSKDQGMIVEEEEEDPKSARTEENYAENVLEEVQTVKKDETNEEEVENDVDEEEQEPLKTFSEFQCQTWAPTTMDSFVQSDMDDGVGVGDELNEVETKRALSIFIDATLSDTFDELCKDLEINQLRQEKEDILFERERDLERLQRLLGDVKSVISEKEILMTRIDILEREKLKQIASEIYQYIAENSLENLSSTLINGLVKHEILMNHCVELENDKLKLVSRQIANEIVQNLVGDSLKKLSLKNGFVTKIPLSLPQPLEDSPPSKIETETEKIIEKKNSLEKFESEVTNEFLPWLNSRVWGMGSQKILSRLLEDVIKVRGSYCRHNAKKFLKTTLETFDDMML